MKEYDLYVPLVLKKGRHLPIAKLEKLKKALVKQFGGLTYFPQKTKGFWKIGKATFQDEIVILRVLAAKNCKSYWKELKRNLQKEWQQKEILIVVKNVKVLS